MKGAEHWDEHLFVFLSAPGRLWIWMCAQICGLDVEGVFEEPEDRR